MHLDSEKITSMKGALKWTDWQTVNLKHLIQCLCACIYEQGNTVTQTHTLLIYKQMHFSFFLFLINDVDSEFTLDF